MCSTLLHIASLDSDTASREGKRHQDVGHPPLLRRGYLSLGISAACCYSLRRETGVVCHLVSCSEPRRAQQDAELYMVQNPHGPHSLPIPIQQVAQEATSYSTLLEDIPAAVMRARDHHVAIYQAAGTLIYIEKKEEELTREPIFE